MYIQKIIFGSPGTGKSHRIENEIVPNDLAIMHTDKYVIKTVFHPEYTYGDFMGKLLPFSRSNKVEYHYYAGVFLRALSKAYREILNNSYGEGDKDSVVNNVALVIDEINRGNSSAIFGNVFQLLDRNQEGWSSYEIGLSKMEFEELKNLITGESGLVLLNRNNEKQRIHATELNPYLDACRVNVGERQVRLPPNLSIVATMNTSDSSIYYMDSAFKRRWDWEFVSVDDTFRPVDGVAFESWNGDWKPFVNRLNSFIKSKHEYIRGIEDKQVGYFFIKNDSIKKSQIQSKLMYFLWDTVFSRDKKPLITLLNDSSSNQQVKLVTFGDFASRVDDFIKQIKSYTE